MKSERAKQYIDNNAVVMYNGDRMVDASMAYMAVEMAEQDAEERVCTKSIDAFCAANCPKRCSFGADGNIGCGAKARFIKKLNNNETDKKSRVDN